MIFSNPDVLMNMTMQNGQGNGNANNLRQSQNILDELEDNPAENNAHQGDHPEDEDNPRESNNALFNLSNLHNSMAGNMSFNQGPNTSYLNSSKMLNTTINNFIKSNNETLRSAEKDHQGRR